MKIFLFHPEISLRFRKTLIYFNFNKSSMNSLMRKFMNNIFGNGCNHWFTVMKNFYPLLIPHQFNNLNWFIGFNQWKLIKVFPDILFNSFRSEEHTSELQLLTH